MIRSTYFSFFAFLFLIGCSGPDKLLEKNRPEAAFESIMRMSPKQAQKWYPELIASFDQLQNATQEKLNQLSAEPTIEKWPHIYSIVERGLAREQKLQALLTKVAAMNAADFVFHPEWNALYTEAQEQSAEYYYQRMLAEKQLGDQGDKKAYRSAHRLGNRVQNYLVEYKEVENEIEELRILGTDYVAIYPDYGSNFENPEWLWDDFVRDSRLPWTADWVYMHHDEESLPRIDYYLRSGIDDVGVSQNIENYEQCSNSKEIKVGTKTEREWSEADSAYVDVEVDIYQTVRVSVTNIYQEKYSSGYLNLALFPAGNEKPTFQKDYELNASWTNSSGSSCGDSRAESASCSEESGMYFSFPGSYDMVLRLEPCMRSYIKRFTNKSLDTKLRKQRNRTYAQRQRSYQQSR